MTGSTIVHVCKMKGVGGCEKQLLDLLPALRHRGLNVHLIILEDKAHPVGSLAARFQANGVPTSILRISMAADPWLVFRLARKLRAMKADVVHTHLIHADLHGTLAARLAGVRQVLSTRHSAHRFYEESMIRLLDATVARWSDRGVSISQFAQRYYTGLGVFPKEKSYCVPYGVKPPAADPSAAALLRQEAGAAPGTVVISLVSRLIPGKGHDLFLDAAASLARGGMKCQFWIVGDGPLRPALQKKAAALPGRPAVRFWGFQWNVGDFQLASDIICVPTSPTLREGLNLVLLEAGAMGRPCVASRMAPFTEILKEGETGLFFKPDDPASLADALSRLCKDGPLRRSMGEKARRRIRENFSLNRAVERYFSTYHDLIGRGGRWGRFPEDLAPVGGGGDPLNGSKRTQGGTVL